jgi:hypothetical protein
MAGSGFRAATIPMQNSLITIITIPVQGDIMAVDLTVAGITAAVLMVVAVADTDTNSRQRTAHLGINHLVGLGSQILLDTVRKWAC